MPDRRTAGPDAIPSARQPAKPVRTWAERTGARHHGHDGRRREEARGWHSSPLKHLFKRGASSRAAAAAPAARTRAVLGTQGDALAWKRTRVGSCGVRLDEVRTSAETQ